MKIDSSRVMVRDEECSLKRSPRKLLEAVVAPPEVFFVLWLAVI